MALVIILIKQIKVLLVVNIRSFSRLVQFLLSSASSNILKISPIKWHQFFFWSVEISLQKPTEFFCSSEILLQFDINQVRLSTELIIMRNNAVQLGFQIVTAKILLKPQAWEMKNLFWILQRNGHWSNNYSNGNGIPNGASPADVNNSSGSGSQRGSQSALLSVKKERHKWPKGKDFLFSTWAFVIGKFYLAKTWISWNETFSNTVT